MTKIDVLLQAMVERQASDLFVSVGRTAAMRRDGQLVECPDGLVERSDFEAFLANALTPAARARFEQDGDLDVGYSSEAVSSARFRLNFHRQRGQMGLVARCLPSGQLLLADLGLPDLLAELALAPRGLVLVTGATGSGKSTTLSALVHQINLRRSAHIVTIEDPIEFLHSDLKSRLIQREVGQDTRSFSSALRHVVRESPDVIVIGEMRDAETVEVAVSAAMTGHLVLSTLHTIDASQSLLRLLGFFPDALRSQLCADLSMAMLGIISQRLLPKQDGQGRVAALELLRFTPGASQLLREGRVDELADYMRTTRDPGIIPFNQSLVQLVRQGVVDLETALAYATNPEELKLAALGMRTGVEGFRPDGDLEISSRSDMQNLLEMAVERGASDVHLSVGRPPLFRVAGRLEPMGEATLSTADVRWLLFSILSGRQRSLFELEKELDFSLSLESGMRFRVNAYYQRGHIAVALRAIPVVIPGPSELGLPEALVKLLEKPHGLILVVGPTGSGKTTTVASLVQQINQSRPCHVLTIEDPIEYAYSSERATIDQREVYADTRSFATALKYVLRQDPDVIVVGEMRDLETISSVLTAAETGHLVFATLHTNDSCTTIDRIVDVFPAHQQAQIRMQLAACLLGIVSQRLLPRADQGGRVAAFELLLANNAVRALIREGKTHQIPNVLSTSTSVGMCNLDRSLVDLVKQGKIEREEALRFMLQPNLLPEK
ncbi:MAG: PilT/PilU family type 4a pilus ATPase [Candidatus Eremiobacteraeota bacterium]|nr:PilT/PilU family type 4a pilus ATPase [Candidatus Eremiobacteraeota bacterium]MCW5868356.1 PilT/PilU family type 4a pilus ATPase [Candidatus Eremiobacteraeota bacterium]